MDGFGPGVIIGATFCLVAMGMIGSCISSERDIQMRQMQTEAVKRNVASYVIDPSNNKPTFQWHPTTNTLPVFNPVR